MHSQGSDSSTTRATLTEGKITLNKDTTPTQTSANALGINTDLSQANSQVEKPKEVKKLLAEQKEMAQAVSHISSAVQTYTANKQAEAAQKVKEAEKARQQAEKANNQEEAARYKLAELEAKRELGQWSDGGSTKRAIDTVSILFTSLLAGKSELSTAVSTLSPTVNKIIADETREDKVSNALAHAVWGAIESYAAGGNVVAGAVISSGTELLTPKLAEILYNKTEAELTSDEKAAIISLSSLAGGIAGGLVASSGNSTDMLSDISVGSEIAKNTVTNNYLSDWQKNLQAQQLAECEGSLRCELQTQLYWLAVDKGQDVSFSAGVVASIPEGMVEVVQGTTDILLHPIDTLTALYDLVKEGDIVDVTKQAYLERIENLKTEFERAGASGSFNAGREFGGLLQETIGILAGGAGLAKAGVKVVSKVTAKVPVVTAQVSVGEIQEVVGEINELIKTKNISVHKSDIENLGVNNPRYNRELNEKTTNNSKPLVSSNVLIEENKYKYLFGDVNSDIHNTPRAFQNAQQLSSIGIYDDYQGREIILKSLNNSVKDNKSITKTFSKNINGIYQYFEVRETTISGPGGIRKMEVTFEKMPDGTRRMTTVIFKGGY